MSQQNKLRGMTPSGPEEARTVAITKIGCLRPSHPIEGHLSIMGTGADLLGRCGDCKELVGTGEAYYRDQYGGCFCINCIEFE